MTQPTRVILCLFTLTLTGCLLPDLKKNGAEGRYSLLSGSCGPTAVVSILPDFHYVKIEGNIFGQSEFILSNINQGIQESDFHQQDNSTSWLETRTSLQGN